MTFKELRERAGIKGSELAKRLGVSRSTVSMWEHNRSAPEVRIVLKIADELHCDVRELLESFQTNA